MYGCLQTEADYTRYAATAQANTIVTSGSLRLRDLASLRAPFSQLRSQEQRMAAQNDELWDLWYPKAGATGISFARGRVAGGVETMLVHAAPEVLTVTVRSGDGRVLAEGQDLHLTAETPITRLVRRGAAIERADIWPGAAEIGQLVILPGGEVGTLLQWWHAGDHSEWRWQIELYNHR
jgi:hypothetical protein